MTVHLDTERSTTVPSRPRTGTASEAPENTIAVTERPLFRSTLNQADLDRLLDGKCPWHKDANHTARECRALSNGVIKDDDPKRPHRDNHDRPGCSRTTRACPLRRNSPRQDDDE